MTSTLRKEQTIKQMLLKDAFEMSFTTRKISTNILRFFFSELTDILKIFVFQHNSKVQLFKVEKRAIQIIR